MEIFRFLAKVTWVGFRLSREAVSGFYFQHIKSMTAGPIPVSNSAFISNGKIVHGQLLRGVSRYLIFFCQCDAWPSWSQRPTETRLEDFLLRILQESNSTFSILIITLIYIKRVKESLMQGVPGSTCRERAPTLSGSLKYALFISLIVAHKIHREIPVSNQAWQDLSGLSKRQIGQSEAELMKIVDYNLHISKEEYDLVSSLLRLFCLPQQGARFIDPSLKPHIISLSCNE